MTAVFTLTTEFYLPSAIIPLMRFRKLKKQAKQKQKQKTQEKTSFHYASIPERIKAFITVMFMIYVPILYIITYGVMGGKDEFQSSDIAPFVGVFLYGLIYVGFLYKSGQTPGKKAYTMRVVDAKTHEKISLTQAILRFFGFLFSATILIGLIFPFYRKDKRALHDLIANTVVLADE